MLRRSSRSSNRWATEHSTPCRRPAARAGAAGPRRARAPFRRLRFRGRRRTGSPDRGGGALAARRRSGESARVAPAGGDAAVDGVPFGMPTEDERAERVRSVLRVLYLIFNEGYAASGG